jgi:hypothetical protein
MVLHITSRPCSATFSLSLMSNIYYYDYCPNMCLQTHSPTSKICCFRRSLPSFFFSPYRGRNTLYFLHHQRCTRRMSRFAAADTGIVLVLPRVTQHLSHCAGRTPQRAANVLATVTVLFRNLVTGPHVFSCPTETVEGPRKKEKLSKELEDSNKGGSFTNGIRNRGECQGRRVD